MSALGVDLRVEAGFQHVDEVKSEETCREKSHVCAKARFPANDLLALQPDTAPRQSHNANSTANVHQRNACAEARDDCRHYRHRVPSHCQRSCVRSLPITYHWARTYTFALNESRKIWWYWDSCFSCQLAFTQTVASWRSPRTLRWQAFSCPAEW